MSFNSYEEASTIDQNINTLLKDHPINMDNVRDWLNFSRTLQTTLKLINHEIFRKTNIRVEQ